MAEINIGDIISTRTSNNSSPNSSQKSTYTPPKLPGFVIPLFAVIGSVIACGTVIIFNPKLKPK